MHTSIEVEYWVVDAEDGSLATPGPLADVSDQVEEEFVEPLLEVKTPPCDSVAELRESLVGELQTVLAAAAEHDRGLVPLGTPVNCESIERWPDERGDVQEQVVGPDFRYARRSAGTHVHVEQRNVTDQLNLLTALDPACALLNSSPYVDGERVASSARAFTYRNYCYAEFPEQGQLWDYVETVGEWKRRLERRFEGFREAAVEAGADADAVDEHFSPETAVWTPVRLREEVPTVEWRAPDTGLPSQVLRLAGDVEHLMECIHHTNVQVRGAIGNVTDDGVELPTFPRLEQYARAAIEEGLDSDAVGCYLERLGFDLEGYDPLSAHFAQTGPISVEEARELRLRYANLLERDVRGLARAEPTPADVPTA